MENSEAPNSAISTALPEEISQDAASQASLEAINPPPATTDEIDALMEDSSMGGTGNLQLTHGLEALLGGLEPIPSSTKPILEVAKPAEQIQIKAIAEPNAVSQSPIPGLFSLAKPLESTSPLQKATPVSRPTSSGSITMTDAPRKASIPGLFALPQTSENLSPVPKSDVLSRPAISGETVMTDAPQQSSIPGLFSLAGAEPTSISTPTTADAETFLRTITPVVAGSVPAAPTAKSPPESIPTTSENKATAESVEPAAQEAPAAENGAAVEEEHAEWEIDSTPMESSSDSSSSDDSSDEESDDEENSYKFLSPEEQARVLMEAEGSDEEGGAAKSKGGAPRTGHEIEEVVIPKPDVTITPDMSIVELGKVEVVLDNIVLIKAKTSGEYRVLETGSVLCLENRSVLGVVSETLGRVQQPLYSMMFTNAAEITEAGLTVGVTVFYSEQHSTYVFTQALKAFKGSDASNIYDEEVNDDEKEFSDDEQEMEHKRRRKQKWREDHPQKGQQNGRGGGNHAGRLENNSYNPSQGISYDDVDEDGPYKPLARPAGFANTMGRGEAPEEGTYQARFQCGNERSNQNNARGRGRGDRDRGRGGRGRGDRGQGNRGRGDRGRGDRDQGENRGGARPQSGYSAPPYQPQGKGFTQPSQPPLASPTNYYNNIPPVPQNPQAGGFSLFPGMPQWPFPPPPPPQVLQQFLQAQQQNSWPNMNINAATPPPGGAFLNPAFFGNANNNTQNGAPSPGQWNQQNQNGRGRGQ